MTKYVIYPESSIKDISDAIKEKRGIGDRKDFTVPEMPEAIMRISSGSSSQGAVSIDLGISCADYSSNNPNFIDYGLFLISSELFNEISDYYNAGRLVELVDTNNTKYYLVNVLNETVTIHWSKSTTTNHLIAAATWMLANGNCNGLSSILLTDEYTDNSGGN